MRSQISPRTLIEAFLPFTGEVSLTVIYDTANKADLEDQPIRLALRRMMSAGDIEQHGRGRAGAISLTESGRGRLSADRMALQLALAQDADQATWDGRWRLLALSAPESERTIRDSFRREILSLGAASISTGLYLSPHDLTPLLSAVVVPYLVTATADTLTVRGTADPHQIVEALWPAHHTQGAYTSLSDAIDDDDPALSPLIRQLLLADALEASLRDDPLIPNTLRSTPWEPTHIRRRWLEHWNDARQDDATRAIYKGWLPEEMHAQGALDQ